MSIIELNNIKKIYGKNSSKTVALKDLNLIVNKGEFISIMGPSGCGKSTLLNILGVIDKPTEGKYKLDRENIDFRNINDLSEIRNKKIAFVFQNFALIKDMSVINNCLLPLRFRKGSKSEKLEIVSKYLKDLGISEIKDKIIKELSGGQQQRVAIARALAQNTDIILADEPTGALDEKNSENILEILKDLNRKYNKTIILVTHDKEVAKYSNIVYKMKDGEIVEKIINREEEAIKIR